MVISRYDDGGFFPQSDDADHDKVGEDAGRGFNVNIPWNGRRMGDPEYSLAFQQIVLPIAYEFEPQLVIVSAGFDAAVGDPLGGYRVTPAQYGAMTQQLMGLAGGRLVLALEGGYNLSSISACAVECGRAVLGDPLAPPKPLPQPRESALQTVRDVIRSQRPFWSCLAVWDKQLPPDIAVQEEEGHQAVGSADKEMEEQLAQLCLDTAEHKADVSSVGDSVGQDE